MNSELLLFSPSASLQINQCASDEPRDPLHPLALSNPFLLIAEYSSDPNAPDDQDDQDDQDD